MAGNVDAFGITAETPGIAARDALLAQAAEQAGVESVENLSRAVARAKPREELMALVELSWQSSGLLIRWSAVRIRHGLPNIQGPSAR